MVNESVDVLHAKHILAAWREGQPVSASEQELVEGVFEHVVREMRLARGKLGRIELTLRDNT